MIIACRLQIGLWEYESQAEDRFTIGRAHKNNVSCVVFADDQPALLSFSEDGCIKVRVLLSAHASQVDEITAS